MRFLPRETPVAQKHRAISFPQSLYGRAYADVTTKISRIDRLPGLFIHGAPRALLQKVRKTQVLVFIIFLKKKNWGKGGLRPRGVSVCQKTRECARNILC